MRLFHSLIMGIGLIQVWFVSPLRADVLEGFTEPFRQIEVAFAEPGIIDVIHVSEGDTVKAKQVLAELRREVLLASLEVATKLKDARGKLDSATAELKQRTSYLARLEKLQKHASPEEISTAVLEKEIAEAQLLSVREELEVRVLEYKRIEEEIERRRVRSPLDGVVVHIEKDVGEFVSPSHPVVMTVVQLNPLMAVFSVSPEVTSTLSVGKQVRVQVGNSSANTDSTVHFISPVLDAQSGTVLVKVRIPNPNSRLRSGDKCRLVLSGSSQVTTKDAPTSTKLSSSK